MDPPVPISHMLVSQKTTSSKLQICFSSFYVSKCGGLGCVGRPSFEF